MRRFLSRQERAFTLVELLAVLAMVTLLACLCLPALARVEGQSWQAQCAANLKQLGLALQIYGAEYNHNMPAESLGGWVWDVSTNFTATMGLYGAGRQQMYCPANELQNQDGLWNYAANLRVIGYSLTLPGTGSLAVDDQNPVLSAHTVVLTGSDPSLGPAGSLYRINPARRVLVADVIVSQQGGFGVTPQASYDWNRIEGGYTGPPTPFYQRTSHLNGIIPAGGNVGMLDGHVEWDPYTNITCHTTSPGFWW